MTIEQTIVAVPLTDEQLKASIAEAVTAGNYALVQKLAAELNKGAKSKAVAEHEAKLKALVETTLKVKSAIGKAIQKMVDNKELDKADGVWYAWDFGSTESECKLVKGAPKAPRASGGGTHSTSGLPSNEQVLTEHPEAHTMQIEYRGTTDTYDALFAQSTDKNWRYGLRVKLLKSLDYIK